MIQYKTVKSYQTYEKLSKAIKTMKSYQNYEKISKQGDLNWFLLEHT